MCVKTQIRARAETTRMKAIWGLAEDGARHDGTRGSTNLAAANMELRPPRVAWVDGGKVEGGKSFGSIDCGAHSVRGTSLESLSQNESPHQKMGSDRTNAGTESHSETYQQKERDRPPSRQETSTRRLFGPTQTDLEADP